MRRILIATAILAGLGVAVSSYGLWQHFAPLGAAFCNITETFSCDIVNKSAYSEIAGIPVALIGIVGYAVLAIVALSISRMMRIRDADDADMRMMPSAYPHHLREKSASSVISLLILSLLGLLFQGALTVIELWWIGAYCPICIASQVIILAITILALIVYQNGRHSFARPCKTVSTDHPMNQPIISTLTCPQCGATQQETIPTDRCQHAYTCTACGKIITAPAPDCCVFCSYGDRKCPVASGASANQ